MARLVLVVGSILCLFGAGCESTSAPPERPPWEDIKIGDLAPPPADRLPNARLLGTVAIDAHVFELPADNLDRMEDIWRILSPQAIRMTSYSAFTENTFRIRYGRQDVLTDLRKMLLAADAQHKGTMSLAVTDYDLTDLPIAESPVGRQVTFVGTNLRKQTANVGPGVLALRFKAEPVPGARGVRKVVACPVYALPLTHAVEPLQAKAREREFYFGAAAFALPMAPGDLVVLAPDEYTGERRSLGGLFFCNPEGTLFFNPSKRKPPEHKPSVRVYVLVCTSVSD